MSPSVKNASGTKSKVLSKREEKKRINIRWNSGLFFQVGLAATLLLCFLVMESDWSLGTGKIFQPPEDIDWVETGLLAFRVEEPVEVVNAEPQKKITHRVIPKPLTDSFKTVADNSPILETKMPTIEVTSNQPLTGNLIASPKKESGPSLFDAVQFVPVFPGCESLSNNDERRACMSSKIDKFINRKFNTERFSELEPGKVHSVSVQFIVGKDGKVKDIRTRSLLPELEMEAERVIGKMPLMQPGKQGDIEVDVLFNVPIRFVLQ